MRNGPSPWDLPCKQFLINHMSHIPSPGFFGLSATHPTTLAQQGCGQYRVIMKIWRKEEKEGGEKDIWREGILALNNNV